MNITQYLLNYIQSTKFQYMESDGLLNGNLGMVFYNLMLYRIFKKESYLTKIEYFLKIVLDNVNDEKSSVLKDSSLENGLSGLGFVLYLLLEDGIIDDAYADQIATINEVVSAEAHRLLEENNFDFLRGPVGILHYLATVNAKEYTCGIVEKMYEIYSANNHAFFYNESHYLEGVHIGYAHGICAIVKVLNDVDCPKCALMITGLLKKLKELIDNKEIYLEGKRYFLPRSIHKPSVYPEELNYRAVLAWSNSDVNFSTLVYSLKPKYLTPELMALAEEIAVSSVTRKREEETRIKDHRFFYGSSGALKMYTKLYRNTKNQQLKRAADFWYKKTVNFLLDNSSESHPLSFLNNLPGTTLALLEYEMQVESDWSVLML